MDWYHPGLHRLRQASVLWWALLVLFAVAPAHAHATPYAAEGRPVAVCIKRAVGSEGDVAAILRAPAGFDCRTPQRAWGPGDYWAVSTPLPPTAAREPVIVRGYGVWQTRETVWAGYADGAVVRVPMTRGALGTGVEHVLPARAVPATRLLWRIDGASNTRGIVVGVRLIPPADYTGRSVGAGVVIGGFIGLCLGLLFLQAILWLALRREFQLGYCAMVGGVLLYVAVDAGLARRVVGDFGVSADLKLTSLTFTICVAGGLWFARSFLEPQITGLGLKRASRGLAVVFAILSLVQTLLPPSRMQWIDAAQGLAFLAVVVMVIALAWRTWTRRSAYRWIWSATAIVPALLAAMRAANSFPALGTLFAMQDKLLALTTGGIIASSLAIAYRIHLIARERDEARGAEIAARLLADTDPLTGLLNRRAFLSAAIGREDEQVLMLCDLDHFKAINETIGHDGGDEVLRAVARALEAAVPAGVLVARMGGEEFALLAPATLALDPADVLNDVRAAQMPYDVAVTISIGVCTGPLERETDWKAMYRDADRALFAAKAAGRDRARLASPSRPERLAVAA